MPTEPKKFRLGSKNGSVTSKIKDFLFGLFLFELHQENLDLSRRYRNSIELILFAEFLGIPFMTSHITLKILPYFIKDLEKFKVDNLKEGDILVQIAEHDLH